MKKLAMTTVALAVSATTAFGQEVGETSVVGFIDSEEAVEQAFDHYEGNLPKYFSVVTLTSTKKGPIMCSTRFEVKGIADVAVPQEQRCFLPQ